MTRMHSQWDWLCLVLLIISSVTAEIEDGEVLGADVEVEDFDQESQQTDVDKEESSLGVRFCMLLIKACVI